MEIVKLLKMLFESHKSSQNRCVVLTQQLCGTTQVRVMHKRLNNVLNKTEYWGRFACYSVGLICSDRVTRMKKEEMIP